MRRAILVLLLCISGGLLGAVPKAYAANPVGHLDHAAPDAIFGWAYDADAPDTPVEVHIYVDGVPTKSLLANQHRQDLVAAGITTSPLHGFGWVPEGLPPGLHTVEAWALNIGGGENPRLAGARTYNITSQQPRGTLDIVSPGFISGWAYDADAGAGPAEVHIYIDGQHQGTVLADDYRPDLPAAGVAPDPWHGFVYNPATLPPGEHTVEAWVINAGGGGNPQLHRSPQVMTVPADAFSGVSYLDNGTLRIGMNLSWGGALTEVSHAGHNMIDAHDTGRLLQASLYDSTEIYNGFDNWGWNPVQGGDKHNHGSRVLTYTNNGTEAYVKTDVFEFNPDDKGGGVNQGVAAGTTLEQWVSLDSLVPERASIRYRITTTQSRLGDHEVPALFTAPWLTRLETYQGNTPWQHAPSSELAAPEFPQNAEIHDLFEYWAAWTNDAGFGLLLYFPNHNRGTSANAYTSPRDYNYFRPGHTQSLGPQSPLDISFHIIIGNVADSRDIVYDLAGY